MISCCAYQHPSLPFVLPSLLISLSNYQMCLILSPHVFRSSCRLLPSVGKPFSYTSIYCFLGIHWAIGAVVSGFQSLASFATYLYVFWCVLMCHLIPIYIPLSRSSSRAFCPYHFLRCFASEMEIDPPAVADQYVYPPAKMRKYYSEYLAGSDKQRFPLLYCIDYYGKIPRRLRFLDPMGNEFEVAVFKRQGKVYLTRGSEAIGQFYGLHEGGLLTFFCFNPSTFIMRVEDRDGNEVIYPTPPTRFTLGNKNSPIDISDDELANGENRYKHSQGSFHHSLCKNLGVDDVSALFMCSGFCEHAFPLKPSVVKLVDERGTKWNCTLEWNNQLPFGCKLMGDWAKFCKKKGLKEGTSVRLGVSQNDSSLLYFMLV